ncbi:MAG: VOC family protein [Candidatus Saccharimonadales bacterium]
MFETTKAFSGFSVDDIQKAKEFYSQTLGLDIAEEKFGFGLRFSGGSAVFVYSKGKDHTPASFTILNFPVGNIDTTVDELEAKGVEFVQYNDPNWPQDEKGIARGLSVNQGPDIAWFKDPDGNVLAVLQDK